MGWTGHHLATLRRRSKTPGVMITQYTIRLPEGKSTPDFQCKPASLIIQEGEFLYAIRKTAANAFRKLHKYTFWVLNNAFNNNPKRGLIQNVKNEQYRYFVLMYFREISRF